MKSARFIRSFLFVLLLLLFGTWVLFRSPQNAILSGEPFTVGKATSFNPAALGKARTAANDDEADATSKTASVKSSPVTGEAATDQLRKSGQYESLAAAFHAARYAAEKIDPLSPHSRGADYFAANPAQQLRAWFRPDGVELASGRPTREGTEPWSVQVRLRAAGRAGALAETGQRAIRAEGNRVEVIDPASTITEWYENKSDGIEQGFTIAQRPPGVGALELVLRVEGNLQAEDFMEDGTDGARFVESDGTPVVSYTKLKAWDATGRELPARMETHGGGLALLVNDAGAYYPLTVDPLFTNIEAKLCGSNNAGAHFGSDVAISGETAIIGAASNTADQIPGRAYVFLRNGGTWNLQATLLSANDFFLKSFGDSVALNGDTAAVATSGGCYIYFRNGTEWTQQARLSPNDSLSSTSYGGSISLSADLALVGDSNSESKGCAYVFVRNASVWSYEARITSSDGVAGDAFGATVSLNGSSALIGAPNASPSGRSQAGSAYVFLRSGATWTQQAKLGGSDASSGDSFGSAVSIEGDNALIGARRNDIFIVTNPLNGSGYTNADQGNAYVFVRAGTTWTQQARLLASDGGDGRNFGSSVAFSGNTAVVGSGNGSSSSTPRTGCAYIFIRSGTTWSQQTKLLSSQTSATDNFGFNVSMSGETVLVGASYAGGFAASGTAFAFLRNGSTWNQQAEITPFIGANVLDTTVVALDEGTAILGCPSENTSGGTEVGAAYVFQRAESGWVQQSKLTGSSNTQRAHFGNSVCIHGDTAILGAVGENSVYVFTRTGAVWNQQSKLQAADDPASGSFGYAVGLDADTAVIGAPTKTNNGCAYIFQRTGTAWSQQAKIAPTNPAGYDLFGNSVAIRDNIAICGAPSGGLKVVFTYVNPSPPYNLILVYGPEYHAGAAYVFTKSGTDWSQQAQLFSSQSAVGDRFGCATAISDGFAVIGASAGSGIVSGSGSAFVFRPVNSIWVQSAKLSSADGLSGDAFGASIATTSDRILIGAPGHDNLGATTAGAAYVFSLQDTAWTQSAQLNAGINGTSNISFGTSVAISDQLAVVGAQTVADTSSQLIPDGSAYAFLLGELPAITAQPVSRTVVPGTNVTFSVTATGYAPLRYQWRRNGFDIDGANGPGFTIQVPPQSPFDMFEGVYDVVVSNIGGVATSAAAVLKVNALSEFSQQTPAVLDPRSNAQGFLVVNLSPNNLTGTGWRFVGEQQWRVPGVPVGGLATGNREIEFRPVAGYLHPLREPVSVTSGAAATVVEREYFQGGGVATASLSVTLLPVSLGAVAQWRLLGEGDAAWRASGASLGGLAAGVYLVECKDVAGYATPRPISVTIGSGEAKTATATYFLADAAVGTQPGVVGFDAVTSATANPFTYVGQLRSDSGSGTGFVVRQRVVATAAHVVFDDGTLSAATGVQWVFQRERGIYEPVPQIPRGSYILSGYSAQRIADATPGTSSVAAQNLDVASVWFYEQDAGRGGSGGYLASDSTDNEWLISPRLKTIVGYPLDGIATANQGRIHATPPINATFTHANARVYLTDNITSRGGNSGGPVCVQYDDGRYFPAAIYLGGSTQTRVRAIDSDVITLFDSAEESSTTGENSTNGGSTQTNSSLGSTPSGTLTVTIEPQTARDAGAGWRIGSAAFFASGQSKPYLSAGDYTVTFKSVEGFQTPSTRSVTVEAGKTVRIAITYNLPSTPSAVAVPTYTGLIIGNEGVAGRVVAGISKAKRLTLKLRIGSESLMITGAFDASGAFSGSIPRRGKTPALVTLTFDTDVVAQLTGEITLDGISYDLSAGKSPFQTKSPTSLAGKYTFVLPRDPGFVDPTTRPFGTGYALGNVSSSGAVSVAGVLGDGTAFAFSAPLFADATCPVYVQPYAKHGLLAGTLVFHDATTADGTLLWQKPATSKGLYKSGFTGSIAALGSRWTPPTKNTAALDITDWNLVIGNGVLTPPLAGTTTLSSANIFTLTGTAGTKLTLAPKTGLLSGSFPGANGKPVKFNGALLQSQRIGRGVFALPDKTGPVTLDPP